MKTFQVIRTHTSPYQAPNFLSVEKELISSIPTLIYKSLNEADQCSSNILITNTSTKLKEIPSQILNNTKLIVHPNSGYDNLVIDDLWKEIPIIIGHVIRAQAVAEYSVASVFEFLTDLPQHISWFKQRSWNRKLISECSIWVFGYGHIGKIVADTFKSLGAKITVVDPFIKECPHFKVNSWNEGNLKKADVVIACSGLNSTSRKMFNQKFFQNVSPSLLFINGARGGLVDEAELKTFLLAHPDAFAFLDVFENEPFNEEWHHFPQVWKTSHIAGVFKNLDDKILNFEFEVIKDFLAKTEEEFIMKYKNELLQNKWHQGVLI
ncbi:MAG: NAD(P)-dependent oxidoreductase [Bacteriovoracaceae bacterium]